MDKNILLAKNHFPTYCKYMYPKYIYADHLIEIMKALTDIEQGRLDRLILNLPPRSGKSLTVSTLFPSWFLTKQPDKRIIFSTYESNFASSFGAKVRDNIKEHDEFGIRINNKTNRKDEFEIKDHLGGYKSSGVGSSITGRGADIAIIDDPIKNAEEAKSSTIKEKIIDWYESTLLTRLEPDGAIILIQTRWALDDLTGWLLDNEPDEWTVLNYPALNDKGESFFPQRFTTEQYLRIKKSMSDYWWNALYMNNPIADGGMFFKPDMITLKHKLDERIVKKCRAWDIATHEELNEKKSNYTVGALMYLLSDNKVHIQNITRFRGTVGEVEKKIKNVMSNDDYDTIQVMEQQPASAGIALKQHWSQYLTGYPLRWVYSNKDKESKALPLATAIETGMVTMKPSSWNDDLIHEFEIFNPADDNFDDIVDSCSLGFNFLNRSRNTINMDTFRAVNNIKSNNVGTGIFSKLGRRI